VTAFGSTALVAALLAISCGGEASTAEDETASPTSSGATNVDSGDRQSATESAYRGPSVGPARGFSALARTAIRAVNGVSITGNLGVSGAKVESITGFDPTAYAFGTDSTPPNSLRTVLTQREVDALVDDLSTRDCDARYVSPGAADDATEAVTFHPGVICVDGTSQLVSGRVILDAGGDPNAFFVIRSNPTLTVADATQVVLEHGAQACGVFWQARKQVTIGARVEFLGTVIAGTGITMHSGATLIGRALAQTEAVSLDGNTVVIPTFDPVGGARTCSHEQ
jgi:hypothetical protein